jgi:poly(A) polymerase
LRTGNKEDDLITAIAILCHDFGKVTHTQYDKKPGHITAHGHEEAGAEPTRTFLHRLRQYELAKEVVPLVENHLAPVFGQNSARALRRLSVKVKRLDLLCNVSRADQGGRPPKNPTAGLAKVAVFEQKVKDLEIPVGGPKPLIGGDFLIRLGLTPGPHFKTILDMVYEAQLDGFANTPLSARNLAVTTARELGFDVEYK